MSLKETKISLLLYLVTLIPILAVAVVSSIAFISNKVPEHDSTLEYTATNELKYWEVKNELIKETQSYVDSIAPMSVLATYELVDLCEEYNVDICFVLAQGELESHFGTKGLASKTNSVWNIGAFDKCGYVDIHNKFKYNHPNASIAPYIRTLKNRYLCNKVETDLLENFIDKDGNRYATSPAYESGLKVKYLNILNTTKIDSLSMLMHKYALLCNRW